MTPHAITADRCQALIKANQLALTRSTCEEVFQGMCRLLSKLIPYNRAGLTVYDPNLAEDARFPSERQTTNEGFRSLCSVPLVVREEPVSVL
jgi:hypothetical protein